MSEVSNIGNEKMPGKSEQVVESGSSEVEIGEARTINNDDQLLQDIGYKPEFAREFTRLSTLSYAISIMGVLGSVPATWASPLGAGGPATAIWYVFLMFSLQSIVDFHSYFRETDSLQVLVRRYILRNVHRSFHSGACLSISHCRWNVLCYQARLPAEACSSSILDHRMEQSAWTKRWCCQFGILHRTDDPRGCYDQLGFWR